MTRQQDGAPRQAPFASAGGVADDTGIISPMDSERPRYWAFASLPDGREVTRSELLQILSRPLVLGPFEQITRSTVPVEYEVHVFFSEAEAVKAAARFRFGLMTALVAVCPLPPDLRL
jgi:hypothetical protein